jgi:hypothetical protein
MSSHISNGHPYEVYGDRQSRDQTLYFSAPLEKPVSAIY